MATSNTVVALKSAFLRTQTRILTQPLQPEEGWVEGQRDLNGEAVKEAVREVNRQIRRHTRTVYPISSMRHIAEQIDKLYWDSGAPDLEIPDVSTEADEHGALTQDDDLTLDPVIEKLPSTWDAATEPELVDYTDLHDKLVALSQQRKILREKVAQYKRMEELLEPFKEPAVNVQPNLVTRDGPLADELARLKSLSIRLSARLGVMQAETLDDGEDNEEGLELRDGGQKVRDLIRQM